MCDETSEMLAEAKRLTNNIIESLPSKVQIDAFTQKSKLPFKAVSIRELSIHRIAAIANVAVNLLEKEHIVPGVILTRAVVETTAIIFVLCEWLDQFNTDHDVDKLDNVLMNCMLGSRNNTGPRTAVSIISHIEKVDRVVTGFKSGYESLCEYTHPNWAGTLGTYGKINKSDLELILGQNDRRNGKVIGASNLVSALDLYILYYMKSGELILNLNTYLENI